MKSIWYFLAASCLSIATLAAQPAEQAKPLKIDWQPLKIAKSRFPRSVGMMDAERDDYAGNLAGVAITQLQQKRANKESQELARRMIALALHLSPRNKTAVVLNFKLGREVVPEPPEADYRPQTLSGLLMKRAQLLVKQEGQSNIELAGYLFDLAVSLAPESEDAIYLSELHRISHGEANWAKLIEQIE